MSDRRKTPAALVAAIVGVSLSMAACGGDEGTVSITLQEFSIGADPASIPAGSVTFEVINDGPNDVHEFVVIATDLDVTELPTVEDGSVDETGEGMEVIGEIEDIPVGETQSVTLELEAGNYALICNIYDADEDEAHYQEGMRTPFTVE
jgi:iron uptake system component EfeO